MFSSFLFNSTTSNEDENNSQSNEVNKEFMDELISEIETINTDDLNNIEEEEEIEAFLKKCNIADVYKQLKNYPQVKKHPLFIKMYQEYMDESECVEYLISNSHKRFGQGQGVFLSDLWDDERVHLDDGWSNIETIVLVDNFTDVEHVIKNPKNIEDFMESFRVNKYVEPSMFNRFMGFNNNTWDFSVFIYTKDYIYTSGGYSGYYNRNYDYSSEELKYEPVVVNLIIRNIFNIIRRNPL